MARPGETAIREGNQARTVSDVTVGHQVHIKGAGLPAEASGQPVRGGFASFLLRVQGSHSSGNVQVDAGGASFKCNGSKGTAAECEASVKQGPRST